MKKKVFLLLAALMFCQAAFAVVYHDFYANAPSGQRLYYKITSDSTVAIMAPRYYSSYGPWPSGYSDPKPTGNLIIPDSVTYNGITYAVTVIKWGAFSGCTGLTSVTIPITITDIGIQEEHVYGCDNYPVFGGCSGLTSVYYAGTVDQWNSISIISNPIACSHNLYINNVLLTDLVFSDTTTLINSNFAYDTALTSVIIPNSVTSIGGSAFSGCTGLTSVTIGNSVTSIGGSAFMGCSGLTSVNYTGTADQWHSIYMDNTDNMLSNPICYSRNLYLNNVLLTDLVFSETTTLINSNFAYDTALTSVTIPNSVTIIGHDAFSNCTGLTSVTIPNSVTSIEYDAFLGCSGLTSVTIPNSVTSIGIYAFSSCTGLTSVTFNARRCDLSNPNPSEYASRVFSNCSNITNFTFGSNVEVIPASLCYGMNGLTSISFLSQMPPQLGTGALTGVPTDIPVYIPCGRLAYYVSQMPQFSNYVETVVGFAAMSDDESMGTVQILTEPSCTNHNAVLYAVPADGYRFDNWSTGSTDNPYTLNVTSDTTIIAYFVSNGGTEGIGDVETNNIHISVFNGRICVEGITNEEVQVYDITGRTVQNRSLPSGVYIVKVGTLPAQKVVVMR